MSSLVYGHRTRSSCHGGTGGPTHGYSLASHTGYPDHQRPLVRCEMHQMDSSITRERLPTNHSSNPTYTYGPTPTQSSIGVLTSCNSECSSGGYFPVPSSVPSKCFAVELIGLIWISADSHIGIYRLQATRAALVERDQAWLAPRDDRSRWMIFTNIVRCVRFHFRFGGEKLENREAPKISQT
jgi:hypothetical protein